eukprot:1434691-Pleurochrysis_carterae.AAC.1
MRTTGLSSRKLARVVHSPIRMPRLLAGQGGLHGPPSQLLIAICRIMLGMVHETINYNDGLDPPRVVIITVGKNSAALTYSDATQAAAALCGVQLYTSSRTYSVVQLDTLRTIAYAVLSGIGVRSMNPVFCSKLVKQYEICAAGTRRNRLEVFAPAQRSIPSPCLTPRFCVVLSFLEDVDDKTVQEE